MLAKVFCNSVDRLIRLDQLCERNLLESWPQNVKSKFPKVGIKESDLLIRAIFFLEFALSIPRFHVKATSQFSYRWIAMVNIMKQKKCCFGVRSSSCTVYTVRFKWMNPRYNIRMYWTNFCQPTNRVKQNIFD